MQNNKCLELNANENSLGMSDSAKKAIIESLGEGFRYPDNPRAELISTIATIHGVAENQISLGNGSTENIRATLQMLQNKALKEGRQFQMVIPVPTFDCAERYANSIGVPVVKIPLTAENYDYDFDELKKAADDFDGISLLYICNPNNPTGIITSTEKLKTWVSNAPDNHYFLLDQAYLEYVSDPSFESGIEWVKQGLSDNLIVIHTFSKLCALAGMRVGYAISNTQAIETIEAFMSRDNTNLSGAVAAIATLNDAEFLALSLRNTNQSRQMIETVLDDLGLGYLPSQTNFIFHEIKGDLKTYIDRMRDNGIKVGREFPPVTGFNRLTLGTPKEMEVFIKVLKLFREKGWV
jgi:histidinol-phosphate aminotransferase